MTLTSSCLVICLAFAITCLMSPVNGRPHPEYVRSLSSESSGSSNSESESSTEDFNNVEPCPPDWVLQDGSCYFFSETTDEWKGARNACLSLSMNEGHLVDIHSQEEQDFVNMQMRPSYTNTYWLALNDIDTEGVFVWADTFKDVNFTFWSSSYTSSGKDRDCVYITYKPDMVFEMREGWDVDYCFQPHRYICETKAVYN